jgi:uncharacterized protein YceH (UPF0502 family)
LNAPPLDLSAEQIRVLGCLLEKQRTTPDAYPLSLNALRLACNQSTNRDPVVDYDEATIRDALHRLERRGLTRLASGAGSRAAKYRHLLAERLPMERAEEALLCVLMLRGPQTPGELKQRGDRMHPFADLHGVQATLERLIERQLAVRLARRPGQKEERYEQTMGIDQEGEAATDAPATNGGSAQLHHDGAPGNDLPRPAGADLEARVAKLEREVAELRAGAAPEVAAAAELTSPGSSDWAAQR